MNCTQSRRGIFYAACWVLWWWLKIGRDVCTCYVENWVCCCRTGVMLTSSHHWWKMKMITMKMMMMMKLKRPKRRQKKQTNSQYAVLSLERIMLTLLSSSCDGPSLWLLNYRLLLRLLPAVWTTYQLGTHTWNMNEPSPLYFMLKGLYMLLKPMHIGILNKNVWITNAHNI